jgi:hypothetical protein
MFSDYFNTLISKIIFKNKKNIILILFEIKNTLKSNRNYIYNKKVEIEYFDGSIIYKHVDF